MEELKTLFYLLFAMSIPLTMFKLAFNYMDKEAERLLTENTKSKL